MEKRKPMTNPISLSCIRLDEHDLQDTVKLADRVLGRQPAALDNTTFLLSKEIFIALALYTAYSIGPRSTTDDMLDFLAAPKWDTRRQTLQWLANQSGAYRQQAASDWQREFAKKVLALNEDRAGSLIRQCLVQWRIALGAPNSAAHQRNRKRTAIQVFEPQSITKAWSKLGHLKDEKKAGLEAYLENALIDDGYRSLPNTRRVIAKLDGLKAMFENFTEPVDRIQIDLILAAAMKPSEFRVTPLLLLGEPGVGKTYFASQIAGALGSATDRLSAGGAQAGFQLTGSHSSYTEGKPGSIFTLLAEGQSAAPVLVIDEVDKLHDGHYPVLPVLLDLLEPCSALKFKDAFFETAFDASRTVFILTANTLDGVPAPLLSRVEVVNVPRPEPSQRLRILQQEAEQLRKKTRRQIDFREAECLALSERTDIDLRKLTRLVRESFARAIQLDEATARIAIPKQEERRSIGFGVTA